MKTNIAQSWVISILIFWIHFIHQLTNSLTLVRLFNLHILQPTRITDHSQTLIDNIFFNSLSHHTISGNIIYDIGDHLPNFLIINKFSALPKQFKISKRDYSNFNEIEFLEDIKAIDIKAYLKRKGRKKQRDFKWGNNVLDRTLLIQMLRVHKQSNRSYWFSAFFLRGSYKFDDSGWTDVASTHAGLTSSRFWYSREVKSLMSSVS